MTTTALQTDPASAPGRKAPMIDPNQVTIEFTGLNLRRLFARLPAGMILDDLKEPEIWQRVQASPQKSLRKFDEVLLVAWDEAWMVTAFVSHADSRKAVLTKPEKITLPARYEALPSDEEYRCEWNGAHYAVIRRKDGHIVGTGATVGAAQRIIDGMYPLVTRG